MQLTANLNMVELVWIVVALFGLFYGLRLRGDAIRDVRARIALGVNHGREDLAQLLVVTASLMSFTFLVFLAAGGIAASIPSPAITTPMSYLIQGCLVLAEASLAFSLWFKQRIRRRVFWRDMADKELQAEARRLLDVQEMVKNTAALAANTISTDANTVSRKSDASILAASAATLAAEHVENVQALDLNTEATDRNTGARDPAKRTRKSDEQ